MEDSSKNPNLIQEEQLKSWLGYKHRERIKQWLIQHGVNPRYGRNGRVCITLNDLDTIKKNSSIEF